jgi:DNA-binding GntR family transcriptional regulator
LSIELGVSRGTLRTALKVLQDDGLLIAVPAKGRVVAGANDEAEISPRRRARQVIAELKRELSSGQYRPGDRFLSTSELEDKFGIGRHAARLVLGELESAGLLTAVHGRGHFVAESSDTAGSE